MPRSPSDVSIAHVGQFVHQASPILCHRLEELSDRRRTVVRLDSPLVQGIGGTQYSHTSEELAKTLSVERVQIAQVAEMLFGRPAAPGARRQHRLWDASDKGSAANGHSFQTIDHFKEGSDRQREGPPTFDPRRESSH
jgi:hypothetical protein